MEVLESSGKVAFLRVHDVGTGWGPEGDSIDVEVIAKLAGEPDKAYGFQLRNDDNRPARAGMLDLLRDAFSHDWTVTIDYEIDAGKSNGFIIRTALTRSTSAGIPPKIKEHLPLRQT